MTRKLSKNLMFTVAGTLLLASCGGGGGSTAAPTAPITPTSNDSLDDIQVSEDFNSFSSIVLVKVEGATETIDASNHTESANAVVGVNTDGSFDVTISNQGDDGDVNLDFDTTGTTRTVGSEQTIFTQDDSNTLTVLRVGVDIDVPFTTTNETINLSYVSFGQWSKTDGVVSTNGFNTARGYTVFGVTTDNVPTTGTATYRGYVDGFLYQATAVAGDPDVYAVRGSLTATADFGNNTITTDFQDMALSQGSGFTDWVDFSYEGTIANGMFTGDADAATQGAGYEGTVNGAFYGPNAVEIGGTWELYGNGQEAAGAFVGEQ
ncbi:transferrin-binding protein-like solute binding protein [Emcibacter nanhaiensis]|uniref:Transferrin-binding protein-like solute binding protein n=1 Tax=Emcibacter nanhaiensis TaxID=1505037 RepID=A0A501PAW0_9PROT|nr:transferrin-binding protein-like solute binding protein [Emcibacter nanhaiensis]TPD57529.1 transferrin-binding protein-like solute binding protein [Emcibacter nanhaiensis]